MPTGWPGSACAGGAKYHESRLAPVPGFLNERLLLTAPPSRSDRHYFLLNHSARNAFGEIEVRGPLDGRAASATRMPDGDNFEPVPSNTVVDPVPDAIDVKPPHAGRAGGRHRGTDFRLDEEQAQGRFKIFPNRARRRGPVDRPPLYDSLKLSGSAARDVQLERHT